MASISAGIKPDTAKDHLNFEVHGSILTPTAAEFEALKQELGDSGHDLIPCKVGKIKFALLLRKDAGILGRIHQRVEERHPGFRLVAAWDFESNLYQAHRAMASLIFIPTMGMKANDLTYFDIRGMGDQELYYFTKNPHPQPGEPLFMVSSRIPNRGMIVEEKIHGVVKKRTEFEVHIWHEEGGRSIFLISRELKLTDEVKTPLPAKGASPELVAVTANGTTPAPASPAPVAQPPPAEPRRQPKFCPECGQNLQKMREIGIDPKFCPGCGYKLP